MKFHITKEWLARKLTKADDSEAAAGGTNLGELRRDVDSRTVTPSALANAPTKAGKVIRYIREQRSWSVKDLATIATVDEVEIINLETSSSHVPSPRSVVYLADALGLSRERFKELIGFVVVRDNASANEMEYRYAARSKGIGNASADDFEMIRALVEVLSEKKK
jgi:transcriptional regulator with XRE-family HTH domain